MGLYTWAQYTPTEAREQMSMVTGQLPSVTSCTGLTNYNEAMCKKNMIKNKVQDRKKKVTIGTDRTVKV